MGHGGGMGGGTGGRGGRGGRVASRDVAAQKAANAEAPRIPNLLPRIARLFAPHKTVLALTITLVLISAGLSVLPPLLTQQAFDVGLFPPEGEPNVPVLLRIVGLMLVLWVASAGLGIAQTYLTASVGNAVMAQLRVTLFDHLQRMELAFFTRTKTGVIQSLQNDVGGVASVLSNTVSSVIGNTVTVLAALVAMLLLSWQLTLAAVILLPLLIAAQQRVGQVRARIATKTQESLSDMTAITQEALSVSGIMLAKGFFRQHAEVDRYRAENETQRGLLGRQARRLDVVDRERGDARDEPADAHERLAQRLQHVHLVRAQGDRDRDHGVDALADEEVVEDPAAQVGVAREPVEREVVAGLDEGGLDALEHLAEVPAIDVGDDHADVARAAGDEAGRRRRHHVAELGGGALDLLARVVGDVAAAGQSARGRRLRHACDARDVGQDAHAAPSSIGPAAARGSRGIVRISSGAGPSKRQCSPMSTGVEPVPCGIGFSAPPRRREVREIPECSATFL